MLWAHSSILTQIPTRWAEGILVHDLFQNSLFETSSGEYMKFLQTYFLYVVWIFSNALREFQVPHCACCREPEMVILELLICGLMGYICDQFDLFSAFICWIMTGLYTWVDCNSHLLFRGKCGDFSIGNNCTSSPYPAMFSLFMVLTTTYHLSLNVWSDPVLYMVYPALLFHHLGSLLVNHHFGFIPS